MSFDDWAPGLSFYLSNKLNLVMGNVTLSCDRDRENMPMTVTG